MRKGPQDETCTMLQVISEVHVSPKGEMNERKIILYQSSKSVTAAQNKTSLGA